MGDDDVSMMGQSDSDGGDDPQAVQRQTIVGLQRIEMALVQLLQIAADAIDASTMNLDAPADEEDNGDANDDDANEKAIVDENESAEQFQQISTAYFQLLDKIQLGLRNSFHSLTRTGLLVHSNSAIAAQTGDQLHVPYTALQSTQQLEMELHSLTRLTRLLSTRLESIIK